MDIKINSEGLGLGRWLFIVFLVLKLCGIITWSWWWVTAPLWIPIALCVGALLIGLVIAGIVTLWENIVDWWVY